MHVDILRQDCQQRILRTVLFLAIYSAPYYLNGGVILDKLVISGFFALLAAFITAVVSFVKLVNDKEGRISDHRQEWTTSARDALADLISKVSALSDFLAERTYRSNRCNELSSKYAEETEPGEKERIKHGLDYQKNMLEVANTSLLETRKELHRAYGYSRLHFKLNDPLFLSVERLTEEILSNLRRLGEVEDDEKNVAVIRGDISTQIGELVAVSRGLLKNEWEKIKAGEPVYMKSKVFSKWAGILLFFILVGLGAHTFISNKANPLGDSNQQRSVREDMVSPVAAKPDLHVLQTNSRQAAQDIKDAGAICNFYSMPRDYHFKGGQAPTVVRTNPCEKNP